MGYSTSAIHIADVGEGGVMPPQPNHMHGIIILHECGDADASIFRTAILSPTVGAHHDRATHGSPLRVQPGSLGSIMRQYKSSVTRKIIQQFGGIPHIWQRNYYEHVIRDEADANRIQLYPQDTLRYPQDTLRYPQDTLRYIESNPVNWVDDDENPEKQ